MHRFITRYLEIKNLCSDNEKISNAKLDIVQCIRYCIGITYLWRGASGFTDRIENVYRGLFQIQTGDNELSMYFKKDILIKSLAFKDYKIPIISTMFEKTFTFFYVKKYVFQDVWVEKISSIEDYYARYPRILRFLILLAYSHAKLNSINGLIEKEYEEKDNILYLTNYISNSLLTLDNIDPQINHLEHVAPQTPIDKSDWPDVYEPPSNENEIGNIVIISDELNQLLTNKGWSEKKEIYSKMAKVDLKEGIHDQEFNIPYNELKQLNEVIMNIKHIYSKTVIYKSVALTNVWNRDHIDDRTQNIAEICWKDLNTYLPIDYKLVSKDIKNQICKSINHE